MMLRRLLVLGVVFAVGGCSLILLNRKDKVSVRAVVLWKDMYMPYPDNWRPYITKSGRLIFRLEGMEKDTWLSFDPPKEVPDVQSFADSALTGSATIYRDESFYGHERWVQGKDDKESLHLRGLVGTSKGVVSFRSKISFETPAVKRVRQDINLITGWIDAPKSSVPTHVDVLVEDDE